MMLIKCKEVQLPRSGSEDNKGTAGEDEERVPPMSCLVNKKNGEEFNERDAKLVRECLQ